MKWSIQRGESKNKVKEAAGVKVGKRKAGLQIHSEGSLSRLNSKDSGMRCFADDPNIKPREFEWQRSRQIGGETV